MGPWSDHGANVRERRALRLLSVDDDQRIPACRERMADGNAGIDRGEDQFVLLYFPITRCALVHSLRCRVKVLAGLYCFTVQL